MTLTAVLSVRTGWLDRPQGVPPRDAIFPLKSLLLAGKGNYGPLFSKEPPFCPAKRTMVLYFADFGGTESIRARIRLCSSARTLKSAYFPEIRPRSSPQTKKHLLEFIGFTQGFFQCLF